MRTLERTPTIDDADVDVSASPAQDAGHGPAPSERRRRRGFSMRVSSWVILWTWALTTMFSTVLGSWYAAAGRAAVQQESSAAHEAWADSTNDAISSQLDRTGNILWNAYRAGTGMPANSKDLQGVLLDATMSPDLGALRFQLVGRGDADGAYTAVGIDGPGGQIGLGSARDGATVWRPYEGGAETVVPGFQTIERPWYTAGAASPDAVKFIGPIAGLDKRGYVFAVVGEPGSGSVWSASLPPENLTRFIKAAAPLPDGSGAAVVLGTTDGTDAWDVSWVSSDLPEEVVRDAVSQLGNRKTRTVNVTRDGTSWDVTVNRLFGKDVKALWVAASITDPRAPFDTMVYALRGAAFGTLLFILFAAVGVRATRSLRRLPGALHSTGSGDSLRLGTTPVPSAITEVRDAQYTNHQIVDVVNCSLRDGERRRAALSDLHVATVADAAEERRRVATELHDGPVQDIICVEWALSNGEPPSEGLLTDATEKLRAVMSSLVEPGDAHTSLEQRIGDVVAGISTPSFTVETRLAECGAVPGPVATVITRAARELLVNSRKHSGAPRAELTLAYTGHMVRLTVCDYGVGLDNSHESGGGFGLMSLAVQARQLGGSLSAASEGGGSRVVVSIPLRASSEPDR